MSTLLFWYGGWGFVIARFIFASVFIAHGWSKIKDLKQTTNNFNGMGFKPGIFWGTIVACLEFFGGICLLLGIVVPYICFLLIIQFIVIIIWKIAKNIPFVGGWELDAVVLALAMLLFTLYGGFYLI